MPVANVDIEFAPFLNVPREDKDEAKKRGARWHGPARRWFIPKGHDQKPFAKWSAELENTPSLRAICPFYVLESIEVCWKCQADAAAVTLASMGFVPLEASVAEQQDLREETAVLVLYSYIEHLPPRLAAFMRGKYPSYYVDFSKTTQSFYWMNHCPCAAPLGDFHLHSEPDGAFFPMEESHAASMTLRLLRPDGHVSLRATPSSGENGLILGVARRVVDPLESSASSTSNLDPTAGL